MNNKLNNINYNYTYTETKQIENGLMNIEKLMICIHMIPFVGIISRILLFTCFISCWSLMIYHKMFLCAVLFISTICLISYHPTKILIKSLEHKSLNIHIILNNKLMITDIYKQGKLKNKFYARRGWHIKRFLLENFSNETAGIINKMIQSTGIDETTIEVLPQYKHVFVNTAVKIHKLKNKIVCSFSQGRNEWTDCWIYHVMNKHPVPCCIVNESGKILFANHALCQWLGHSETDIKEKNFWDLCYDEENDMKLFNFRSSNSIKQALLFHSFSWNESNISGLCWAPINHNGLFNNRTIWNFFPIPIVIFDDKGLLIECNHAFQMSHSSDINWHKETMHSIFGNHSNILKKLIKTPLETHSLASALSVYNVHMKGQWHFLYLPSGEQDNVIACFQSENISPESDKLQSIGKLSTSIAHDFNNLLTAIIGFCDSVLDKNPKGTASHGDLIQIKTNVIRAINLVKHMLSFSKERVTKINIAECITYLEPLFKKLIGGMIKLIIDIEQDDDLTSVGQSDFLDQILLNLVMNARDAIAGKPGQITISVNSIVVKARKIRIGSLKSGKYVRILVTDSGSGIDEELHDKIFDPFFSTKSANGTGLGLSTVSNLIIKNNCGLDFHTEQNVGTTFKIYIPKDDAQNENSEHIEEQAANIPPQQPPQQEVLCNSTTSTQALNILLIEDEDPIRILVKRSLTKHKFNVIALRDAHNAEKKLLTEKIDLLITDIMLPGMNGTTLARKVLSINSTIRILFVSGYSKENIMKGETFGNRVHFLEKPFTPEQLMQKISSIMNSNTL